MEIISGDAQLLVKSGVVIEALITERQQEANVSLGTNFRKSPCWRKDIIEYDIKKKTAAPILM